MKSYAYLSVYSVLFASVIPAPVCASAVWNGSGKKAMIWPGTCSVKKGEKPLAKCGGIFSGLLGWNAGVCFHYDRSAPFTVTACLQEDESLLQCTTDSDRVQNLMEGDFYQLNADGFFQSANGTDYTSVCKKNECFLAASYECCSSCPKTELSTLQNMEISVEFLVYAARSVKKIIQKFSPVLSFDPDRNPQPPA